MQIDPSKSALQNLLDLVDSKNANGPTNADQVTAGAVTVIDPDTHNGDNSQITLTGVTAKGFSGSQTYTYGRLSPADEVTNPTGNVNIPPASRLDPTAVLELVEAFYGFIPGELTWVNPPSVPSAFPTTASAQVQSTSSLVYQDGQANVNLNWEAGNTLLLLHADGTDAATSFADAATGTLVAGSHGNALSVANTMVGAAAMGFIQGGSWTLSPPPMPFGTGDFTIEGFINITDVLANVGGDGSHLWPIVFWGQALSASDPLNFTLYYLEDAYGVPNGGGFTFAYNNAATGLTFALPSNGKLAKNTKTHIALVRTSGSLSLYVNGVQVGTSQALSDDIPNSYAADMVLGVAVGGAGAIWSADGYLDEFRISNVARYTDAFTPPATAFTMD